MRISVFESKELQATTLLLKGADRAVAKEIRGRTKAVIAPAWSDAVRANATTALQVRVLADTARVSVSDQNVTLSAASVGKPLAGGATPSDLVPGAEFGSRRYKQFGARIKKGKVVYPAAAEVIPRLASLWVSTVVRTFYDIIEKGK